MLRIKKEINEYLLLDPTNEVLDRFEEVAFLFDGDILLKWGNSKIVHDYFEVLRNRMKVTRQVFNFWIYKGTDIPLEHCTRLIDTTGYINIIAKNIPSIQEQISKKG